LWLLFLAAIEIQRHPQQQADPRDPASPAVGNPGHGSELPCIHASHLQFDSLSMDAIKANEADTVNRQGTERMKSRISFM
jgi:hypothetical protein